MEYDFSTPITKDVTLNALYKEISFDPSVTSFENIRKAMQTGNPKPFYDIGRTVDDTYDGWNIKWTLVHYGEATLASNNKVSGAFFMCSHWLRLASSMTTYENSPVYKTLHPTLGASGSVYSLLSQQVKDAASTIQVKCWDNGNQFNYPEASFWVPGCTEIMCVGSAVDGEQWDYFKQAIPTPTDNATPSRVRAPYNGSGGSIYWLRQSYSTSTSWYVGTGGGSSYTTVSSQYGVVPCFFMAAYEENK